MKRRDFGRRLCVIIIGDSTLSARDDNSSEFIKERFTTTEVEPDALFGAD